MGLGFDPFNTPAEQQRRTALVARFPAAQRFQLQLVALVDRLKSQYDKGKTYDPQFLADLDAILTQTETLNRQHDEIARKINGAMTEALADGAITPADIGIGNRVQGLGLLPVIATLTAAVAAAIVGGIVVYYLGRETIQAIERFFAGQSQLQARINAAKSLSDAYAAYYKQNPASNTPPSPEELLKLFPPSPGGTVAAAFNFGTLALVVGGLLLVSRLGKGNR